MLENFGMFANLRGVVLTAHLLSETEHLFMY